MEKYTPPKIANKLLTADNLFQQEFTHYLRKLKDMMEPGCLITVMISHPTDASKHVFVSEEANPETVIHKMTEIIKRHTAPKIELQS